MSQSNPINITVETRAGRQTASSGSKWEPKMGYSRAVRSGQTIAVTGTVGVNSDGTYPKSVGEQAQRSLDIILEAIKALGGRPETLTGLSGLGDLLLTCSSKQSRNYSLGLALGQGKGLTQALAEAKGTVEGIATANIVARLAVEQNIEMPISGAVHAVVDGGSNPEEEIARLLARPVNPEFHRG